MKIFIEVPLTNNSLARYAIVSGGSASANTIDTVQRDFKNSVVLVFHYPVISGERKPVALTMPCLGVSKDLFFGTNLEQIDIFRDLKNYRKVAEAFDIENSAKINKTGAENKNNYQYMLNNIFSKIELFVRNEVVLCESPKLKTATAFTDCLDKIVNELKKHVHERKHYSSSINYVTKPDVFNHTRYFSLIHNHTTKTTEFSELGVFNTNNTSEWCANKLLIINKSRKPDIYNEQRFIFAYQLLITSDPNSVDMYNVDDTISISFSNSDVKTTSINKLSNKPLMRHIYKILLESLRISPLYPAYFFKIFKGARRKKDLSGSVLKDVFKFSANLKAFKEELNNDRRLYSPLEIATIEAQVSMFETFNSMVKNKINGKGKEIPYIQEIANEVIELMKNSINIQEWYE